MTGKRHNIYSCIYVALLDGVQLIEHSVKKNIAKPISL